MALTCDQQPVRITGAWGAVFSMALAAFVLIASEFMPVSLLPLVAHDLAITEGQTGQAISISGLFAVLTSLVVVHFTRRIDRRLVASGFTSLLVVSGVIVAFAPNYPVLMLGRVLLGIAIGGFWSMSTSIVMRLVSESEVPKALAWINGGNALAATISAPLGSLLGAYIGWRSAFFLVVPIALLALLWQWISLPPMPPRGKKSGGNVLRLLARRQVLLGMASTMFLFMGQFALFTYLRPYLETAGGFTIEAISLAASADGLRGRARDGGNWESFADAPVQPPHRHPSRHGAACDRPGRVHLDIYWWRFCWLPGGSSAPPPLSAGAPGSAGTSLMTPKPAAA